MTASITSPHGQSVSLTMSGEFIARAPRGPDFIGPIWVPSWEREMHPDIATLKAQLRAHDLRHGRDFPPTQWDSNQ